MLGVPMFSRRRAGHPMSYYRICPILRKQSGHFCAMPQFQTQTQAESQPLPDNYGAALSLKDAAQLLTQLAAQEQELRALEAALEPARKRIQELKTKAGAILPKIDVDDLSELLPHDAFALCLKLGMFTPDDGKGYWSTATHRSNVPV